MTEEISKKLQKNKKIKNKNSIVNIKIQLFIKSIKTYRLVKST